MTVAEGPRNVGLVARVQGMLFKPSTEWDVVAAEPASVQSLFVGYACILAAIQPLARLVGGQVFGIGGFFGIRVHPSLPGMIVSAVVGYALALLAVFVFGLIIEALAPSFDGQKDRVQAMKVAVYSSTAGWLAGILLLVPSLGLIAGLCALYNVYLLYQGLPRLMKAPADKAFGYTVVAIVVAIVLWLAVGAVLAAIAGMAVLGGMAVGGGY